MSKVGGVCNWVRSAVTEAHMEHMVDIGYMDAEDAQRWRVPGEETRPDPKTGEVVLFTDHFQRGLKPPGSKFFRDVLNFLNLHPQDLGPNSITSIANFQILYEVYLQQEPSVPLFYEYHSVNRQSETAGGDLMELGGVAIQRRRDLPFPSAILPSHNKTWNGTWFYYQDTSPDGENKIPGYRATRLSKEVAFPDRLTPIARETLEPTIAKIRALVANGLTGVDLARCWMSWRIMPLSRRDRLMGEYTGEPTDPMRISSVEVPAEDLPFLVKSILAEKKDACCRVGLNPFYVQNPAPPADDDFWTKKISVNVRTPKVKKTTNRPRTRKAAGSKSTTEDLFALDDTEDEPETSEPEEPEVISISSSSSSDHSPPHTTRRGVRKFPLSHPLAYLAADYILKKQQFEHQRQTRSTGSHDLAPGLPDTPAPKKRPAEEKAGSSGESTATAAPKIKINPGAQVKRRKVIGSKPSAGGSGPSPSADPTSTGPDSTAPTPPAPPAEPAATEASPEPPTESATPKTAPVPPAKLAASKVAQSSKAPPATSLAKNIQTPEVEVTGAGFNPPVHTTLAKHTGDSSKTERKFEAPDLSAFSMEELQAGFLSRLFTHRDEELALATQLKQKHEETVAALRDTATTSQTAREVAEEKLKVAIQTFGDLQKELSGVRKAAETQEAELRKRAEDAENRLKATSKELSGLRDHVSRMTEAIFGKKSRQLSSDSILKLKAVYTLTEQLYCGAACAMKTLMRKKKNVPSSLKNFLDILSTLPGQINEARKSAARKGAVSALSLSLAYSPELPIEEMADGYPSRKEDGSAFSDADFTQCVKKARVLASTLAEEEDLSKYQAAYNSANERVPAPEHFSNDLTPSSSKQPFAQELDSSPFFEEGEFETLLHCNWDINNLEIQDLAPEDPAPQ